jgi:energy-coupling factor transporter ATP-binding protein EcfA2
MSIRIAALRFRYPGADSDALRDISMKVEPGSVTLVTGRVGSGCSTLLLAMAGLAPHVTGGTRSGSVTILGLDPSQPESRRALAGRVGVLLPTPWTQLSGMSHTVEEEVAFGPANLGWERGRIHESVVRSLALVGMEHVSTRDPRTLSGGELQRVMFAAIAAMNPEVYLLDEPALELDPAGARTIYELLPTMAVDKTVVVATTDVDRAIDVAERVILLDRGTVSADGSPDAVLGATRAVQAGCSTTVATIARAAGMKGPYPLTVAAALDRLVR